MVPSVNFALSQCPYMMLTTNRVILPGTRQHSQPLLGHLTVVSRAHEKEEISNFISSFTHGSPHQLCTTN